jgi:hypothetical protein
LTDRAGKKKGLTGWQHWERHRIKWLEWAKAGGLSVEFEPWDKGSLLETLTDPRCRGLAEYWFGRPLFDLNWFQERFQLVKADLRVLCVLAVAFKNATAKARRRKEMYSPTIAKAKGGTACP